MLFTVLLYLGIVFFAGFFSVLFIYFFGSKCWKDSWYYFLKKKATRRNFHLRGILLEIFNLFFVVIISFYIFVVFSASLKSFIKQIIPNPIFIGFEIIIILVVIIYSLHVQVKEISFRIDKYRIACEEKTSKIRFLGSLPYSIYSICIWAGIVAPSFILITWHSTNSIQIIQKNGDKILNELKSLMPFINPDSYITILQIVRKKFNDLSLQISELTTNLSIILSLLTILIIIITCTEVRNIFSRVAIKFNQWVFVIILFIIGPMIFFLGTLYHKLHYDKVLSSIGNIIDSCKTGVNIVFPLETIRIYFESNFEPKTFFLEKIVNLKSLSIWLLPLLGMIISKFFASISIRDFIINLFPRQVAKVAVNFHNILKNIEKYLLKNSDF